jgi:glutamate N-acetyltransferase/amino-acid N-acetyltransferase
MTTDTREKYALRRFRWQGRTVTLAGVVKGAGMIAPAVATMICIVTTDAQVAPPALHRAFKSAVESTINAVTIDSDESTSDTAVILASGASGAKVRAGSGGWRRFAGALEALCRDLAMAMARDGEGATKLILVEVTGAATARQAEIAAKSVANSPLFKCAVHGGDPNWGRVLAALGKSAARVDAARTTVKIGGATVYARGRPRESALHAVQKHLAGDTVLVQADLHLGRGRFTAYTCDFSRQYVAINADYHT